MRVEVKPELLQWACERASVEVDALANRFPRLPEWLQGTARPTLRQLEQFAKATHAPIGYLFLPSPPEEQLPIPDFRTMSNRRPRRPSPDLLETIYLCQQRQEWFHDYARAMKEPAIAFVGRARVGDDVEAVAADIRRRLRFDVDERQRMGTWTEALRRFIELADAAGVLVMVSGIVGNNTHRALDPDEFRGFSLANELAPLVFLNGADTKAAQMFTLAHELAHVWLGQSALSDVTPDASPEHDVERWCNQVAAELLVPLDWLRREHVRGAELEDEMARLARRFKVSSLVVLRRLYDAGSISRARMESAYRAELERLLAITRGSGGNFYLTQAARVGKRFARALVVSTLEGQTLHRDAFRLLGMSKLSTFHSLGHSLGVM